MRISEEWLRSWVNPSLSTEALADQLTMAGLEIEDIHRRAPPFTGVVLGHILSAEQHPNADRLRVCSVDIGAAAPLQIVCGAPNARSGLFVACATEGAILPGGFAIKRAKMRGVESQGMLCSAKELGLSDESQGILELPAPQVTQALGQDIRVLLDLDAVTFEIKLTPNRADCLSVQGVARELSALTHTAITPPQRARVSPHQQVSTPVIALPEKAHIPRLCGRFSARIIRGVNARVPTPDWMRARLEAAGQRSISLLVDLSNYIMLELGQPTHIFDLDKLVPLADASQAHLVVRWASSGESIALLNDQTVQLDSSHGIILDGAGPVAIAGIMGGARTAVSDETQNILIESAFWWPDAIRGRAQKLKFSTEAGHRFERGVDPSQTVANLEALSALVLELCGGEAGPIADQQIEVPERAAVRIRAERCSRIVGRPISPQQIHNVLNALGFELTDTQDPSGPAFMALAPAHRFDIEIEEDLVEEVARVLGFEHIEARPPLATLQMRVLPESVRSVFDLRQNLVDAGYHEAVTYSFIDEDQAKCFAAHEALIHLLNPIAAQLSTMRPSLTPGLVGVLQSNLARQETRVRLFEIGRIFQRDSSVSTGPWTVSGVAQPTRLGLLAYGTAMPEQWGEASRRSDFFDLKGDIERLCAPAPISTEPIPAGHALHKVLHPGRSALVIREGQCIGWMGECHPSLQQVWGLPQSALLAELDLPPLMERDLPAPKLLSRFPSMQRDLALVVDQSVSAGVMLEKFWSARASLKGGHLLQSVSLFDHYRGLGLADHEKSLAFRFVLQDTEKTLEDAEVEGLLEALLNLASSRFSARLRGPAV
jgi:phenylalanyl-tRNA synthetase beta chain